MMFGHTGDNEKWEFILSDFFMLQI